MEARELPRWALMLEVRERPALLAPLRDRLGREPTDELRRRPPALLRRLRLRLLPTDELRRRRRSLAGCRATPCMPGLRPSWLISLAVEPRREPAGELLVLLPIPESRVSAIAGVAIVVTGSGERCDLLTWAWLGELFSGEKICRLSLRTGV